MPSAPIVEIPTRQVNRNSAGSLDQGKAKTRVVHISLGTQVGGMERLLVEFARHTERQRFELAFLSLQTSGLLAAEIEALDWPVVGFDKFEGLHPWLVVRLAQQLRKLRPAVVHTHNTAALFYGVVSAKLAGIPRIIHTRHGQRFGASTRQTLTMRFLAQFVDYFVSVSCESEGLARAEGVPANRSRTIHNGVDLLQFPYSGPRPFGPITLVARLSAEKDVATLIRAVPHLLALLPAEQRRDLVLRVIGDGRERSALEQLAQELGVGSCVHFLGQQQRVAQALGEASLFALSSRTEGISLTLLEAMSRGLPVVATRVGGTPEVVEDGKTGFLVPAQQPEAMAVAIAQIYLNPALAYRMGREGRARAESHFSVARMIEAYQDLYVAPSINQLRSSS